MTILAARTLRDERSTLTLELDHPIQYPDTNHWSCAFRVRDDKRILAEDQAVGSDALQAIISGIAGLRWQFDEDGPLYGFVSSGQSWFEDELGPGLPSFLPQGLGNEFDRHLRKLIDEAVKERLRELELLNAGVPAQKPGP